MDTGLGPFLCLEDKHIPAHLLASSLVDLATSRGVNKQKLLRGTRIFVEDLQSNKKLSPAQLLHLIGNAQKLIPGHDCAFQLGRRLFPGSLFSSHGIAVSNALLHSRNFSQALRILSLLRMHLCPFLHSSTYQTTNRKYLLINLALGCQEHTQFLAEMYCSALMSSTKLLFGQRIPMDFSFPFKQPQYIQEYQENLGHRLAFSQATFNISFEKKWLAAPCLQRSDELKTYALKQAQISTMPRQGFLELIRYAIRQNHPSSLQQVADQLAMSASTLKRKLKLHDVSFQQLQDELGKQHAIYLLKIKGLTNQQSAQLMRFTDIPNFRRSVKRWTGLTPSQLRLHQPS